MAAARSIRGRQQARRRRSPGRRARGVMQGRSRRGDGGVPDGGRGGEVARTVPTHGGGRATERRRPRGGRAGGVEKRRIGFFLYFKLF
jgi:hypothetical protein